MELSKIENYKGRVVQGIVKSNKMTKSIVVVVRRRVVHPIFKKTITKFTKLFAHDEQNECQVGDVVLIKEVPPISKNKTWVLVRVVEKSTLV